MVVGSAIVSVCLLVLGFTKEIVTFLTADEALSGPGTIGLAVLSIYVLDFAINAGKADDQFVRLGTTANKASHVVFAESHRRHATA